MSENIINFNARTTLFVSYMWLLINIFIFLHNWFITSCHSILTHVFAFVQRLDCFGKNAREELKGIVFLSKRLLLF